MSAHALLPIGADVLAHPAQAVPGDIAILSAVVMREGDGPCFVDRQLCVGYHYHDLRVSLWWPEDEVGAVRRGEVRVRGPSQALPGDRVLLRARVVCIDAMIASYDGECLRVSGPFPMPWPVVAIALVFRPCRPVLNLP